MNWKAAWLATRFILMVLLGVGVFIFAVVYFGSIFFLSVLFTTMLGLIWYGMYRNYARNLNSRQD